MVATALSDLFLSAPLHNVFWLSELSVPALKTCLIVKGKEVMGIKGADMHPKLSKKEKKNVLPLEHDHRLVVFSLAFRCFLAERG